jgi:hypothetical protein
MSESVPQAGQAAIANDLTRVVQPAVQPAQASGPSQPMFHGDLGDAHIQAMEQFKAVKVALGRTQRVADELQSLVHLGDLVTPEDVVKGAGNLVAHGEDPLQLAGYLADMPPQPGEALADWVGQHAQAMMVNEQKLLQAANAARHQLGVSSLHMLAAHSIRPQGQGPALTPGATDNALAPADTSKGAMT